MGLKEHKNIEIIGTRVHNLKNISVSIPRNQLTVITGVSGSGKSSLAFDTLYAEGHRRYIESLSAYARLFLGRIEKPDIDDIKGISPAIAIEQKVNSSNPRSTVGTTTEIYDYLKLLYARIGKTFSPVSNEIVSKDSPESILNYILHLPKDSKLIISCPVTVPKGREIEDQVNLYLHQGYSKIWEDGNIEELNEDINSEHFEIIIDRIKNDDTAENQSRILDSLELAFHEGKGMCNIIDFQNGKTNIKNFNNLFSKDGIVFEEPNLDFFSFNSPYGACKKCEGFGKIMGIDTDLVIPNPNLSLYEDAIVCWKGEKMSAWKQELILNSHHFNFPIHDPIRNLSKENLALIWEGNQYFKGLNKFFKYLESNSYKIQYRVMLSRYRGKTTCDSCNGSRIRKDANYVKIDNTSISTITNMTINNALDFFKKIQLNNNDAQISKRIIYEIISRLEYLSDVGLGYLSLMRSSNTLSGGESQRINLATSIGSSLVGSMYILDEPSIGLHSRDSQRLIKVLKKLRDVGNTVIVVEHDEEMMRAADMIIDIGPEAGRLGGEIVFKGNHDQLIKSSSSLTAQYLSGKLQIEMPKVRRKPKNYIIIEEAYLHNLKNISVKIPLNQICVVTGVSGSGKSTLINGILYSFLERYFLTGIEKASYCKSINLNIDLISGVELINQNPIGKSSRSNPITYTKGYDDIRQLFSKQKHAQINGFKAGYFSFNVDGGRCEKCQGEGQITISMQFMADVHLKCDECNGSRFKEEVLEVKYKGKNIAEILEMTVLESLDFFNEESTICKKIKIKIQALYDVGLEYVQLGQPSNTLSGGEAQRIKLASFLCQSKSKLQKLFIFDEPTTGLHFHDIKKLIKALQDLVEMGHHVIIIEHHMDIIKCSDYIIDLGPEGGEKGGSLLFEGNPEEFINKNQLHSYTQKYLKEYF
ncbi:MAG: excinuclease ABC subunit A [Crocinitomicaceae bacterium]|nr:excinuclease ABC subunit A [Crocinitomicaceae bacterium]